MKRLPPLRLFGALVFSATACSRVLGVDGDFYVADEPRADATVTEDAGPQDASDAEPTDAVIPDADADAGRAGCAPLVESTEVTRYMTPGYGGANLGALDASVFLDAAATALGACAIEGDRVHIVRNAGSPAAEIVSLPITRTCDGLHVSAVGPIVATVAAPGADLGLLAAPLRYVGEKAGSSFPFFQCAGSTCSRKVNIASLGSEFTGGTTLFLTALPDKSGVIQERANLVPLPGQFDVSFVTGFVTNTSSAYSRPMVAAAAIPASRNAFVLTSTGKSVGVAALADDGTLADPTTIVGQSSVVLRGLCTDPKTSDAILTAGDGSGRVFALRRP